MIFVTKAVAFMMTALTVNGKLPRSERAAFLESKTVPPSIKVAVEEVLALIRPKENRASHL